MRLIQKGPKLAGFPTLDEIQSLKDAISAAPPFAKIVRQLIQKVVIGKTPGHQPASLQVHGLIGSILAQMDVLDYMERRFLAEVHEDFVDKLDAGLIETKNKQEALIDSYCEEILKR